MAYSEKFKENLLARALAPNSNISGLARQAGVPKQTLFAWVRQAKEARKKTTRKRYNPRRGSVSPSFRARS
ncbi:MAG: transposase [Myxococcales bacterium]|nr:transposase [Myxococcales bacterium]